LDRCDKAQWRLHWRPVNVFCNINSFLKRKHTVCRTSEMTHVLIHGRSFLYSLSPLVSVHILCYQASCRNCLNLASLYKLVAAQLVLKRWQPTVSHRLPIFVIPLKKYRFCTREIIRFVIDCVLLICGTFRCLTDGGYHRRLLYTHVQGAVGEKCRNTVKVGLLVRNDNSTALCR
jgi:hypothetical protein